MRCLAIFALTLIPALVQTTGPPGEGPNQERRCAEWFLLPLGANRLTK